jgi:NTE family protein
MICTPTTGASYSVEEVIGALSETGSDGHPVFAGFMGHPRPFTAEELAASSLRGLLQEANLPFAPGFAREKLSTPFRRAHAQPHLSPSLRLYRARRLVFSRRLRGLAAAPAGCPRPQGEQRAYSHLTLAEFHWASGADLSLVAADTSGQQMLVLNHRTAPDCPQVYAVRLSMSVPLL